MALPALPLRRYFRQFKDSFFHLNFYRLHLLYFVVVIIISSGILFGSSTADFKLSYIDAISLCTSAICNVGLNTVNLGALTGFQQSVLFVLMLMGDLTIVTISVVLVRRYYFAKRLNQLMEQSETARRIAEDIETQLESNEAGNGLLSKRLTGASNASHDGSNGVKHGISPAPYPVQHSAHTGYGSFPAPWHSGYLGKVWEYFTAGKSGDTDAEHHYLTFRPQLDHKGRFVALSAEQRSELGGVEYRALKLLSWLLPTYAVVWMFCIGVVLLPYAANSHAATIIRTAQPGDLNPSWWATFNTVSAYSNTGLNLLNENMIPFARDYLILIFTGAAILGGNTLYPVFLRASIWTLSKCVPRSSKFHHSLSFLLQHPRRCYLLLFPSNNTWVLFTVQVGINLLAWVLWILLNIGQPAVDPGLPPGQRVFDGLFQAHGVRASGMYVINISDVAPALQFFYLVAMYISAYPLIMSLRETNIYEERSLGQSDTSKYGQRTEEGKHMPRSQIGVHIRKQLAYDIWWLLLAIWLISIIEHQPLLNEAPGFTMFSIMFEVVSAYGTVGFSLGVPYDDYSFCGAWHILSKLVLLTVMLRGRHRILPMAVDRAVLLPGQELMERLDKEFHGREGPHWQRMKEKIREDEEGAQAERPTGHQQDPESAV